MGIDTEIRTVHIEQLFKLLVLTQELAHKLAEESHGRAYDEVRELNEILHLARLQIAAIETDNGAARGVERRRSPRSRWGELG